MSDLHYLSSDSESEVDPRHTWTKLDHLIELENKARAHLTLLISQLRALLTSLVRLDLDLRRYRSQLLRTSTRILKLEEDARSHPDGIPPSPFGSPTNAPNAAGHQESALFIRARLCTEEEFLTRLIVVKEEVSKKKRGLVRWTRTQVERARERVLDWRTRRWEEEIEEENRGEMMRRWVLERFGRDMERRRHVRRRTAVRFARYRFGSENGEGGS